jgi:hypothetical protein
MRGAAFGRVHRHDLEDARADEHAIALLQRGPADLLAVDEGPVRRAEVLDRDVGVAAEDARVPPRDHVLDEDHVEVARATDHDLLVLTERELALPGTSPR